MIANYKEILKRVLVHEGGFSNHPTDAGGATMKGVTQAVYDAFRALNDRPRQTVRKIAEEELQAIYDRQYWDKVAGDQLPSGVDYAVFDFAVNSGVSRAVQYLQRCLAARKLYDGKIDGIIGLKTLAGLKAINDRASLVNELCNRRLTFMRSAKNSKTGQRLWPVFGKGWTARVKGVREHALALAAS
jgi:lysozyme family protein